jgi:GNAT superfamily N-acetyltransferase
MTDAFLFPEDLISDRLNEPLVPPFDCGREMQNRFLRERAWHDQQEMVSVTYLYHMQGSLVGYATLAMGSVVLGTREKPRSIPYRTIAALRLLQLGVDRRFQGRGLGREVLMDVIAVAQEASERVGCRYVALDAQPALVGWYESIGFAINKVAQKQRVEAAIASNRPVDELAVSMRFDLVESHGGRWR